MALSRLGDYIELVDERNKDGLYSVNSLRGISISKILTPTKADTSNLNLKPYKIVRHNWFAYCTVTSRNGNKISLAYNDGDDCIVSSINPVFRVKDETKLLPRYLMMFFNRPEFDRYARFNSWGSARETFSWDDFCDIELEIPSTEVQKKYVAIYEGMLANLRSYEKGLDDLKLVCDGYIEQLRKKCASQSILPFLKERTERNTIGLDSTYLHGVGKEGFILPKQERKKDSLSKCNIFRYHDFVYNPSVLYAGAIALNLDFEISICTEEYVVFYIKDERILRPEYLFLWLKRSECGRFIDFASVDSVRNRVYFDDLAMIKIPVPSIEKQNYASNLFNAFNNRKIKCKELKDSISKVCPILIRGSIDEANRG